jgi:PAS domain S-box-containing protein
LKQHDERQIQGLGGVEAGVDLVFTAERAPISLRQVANNFEILLDSIADGVVVANPEGRVVFSNRAAAQIVGLGVRDVPPEEWTEAYGCFLPDEVTPYPPEQLPLARAMRGEVVREAEVFIRNKENSAAVMLSINATPIKDEAGVNQGGVIVFRDITEQKRTGELVRRLSNAVEQTADSVIIAKKDGTIEYVNPAFEQTTGYSREEALGKTPRILKSGTHDVSVYKELWSTVLSGKTYRGTLLNRRKCGELYHSENTITPMKDEAGNITHLVSVVKDITESLKREEQEFELRLAREVQQRLFPAASPNLPGFDIAGATFPAGEMCGDYFDYICMPRGSLGIVIGDVCGHGLGPSLLMAETRAYLRSFALTHSDIGKMARLLNETLVDDTADSSFVTLLLTRLDPADRSLTYVNAGHVPGFVLDSTGSVREELKSTSVPIGLFPDRVPESSQTVKLRPGDLVALFTDGITESEATDETSFRVEGALEVVRAHRHESSEQIVSRLCQAARDFAQGGSQFDDATAVVLKVDQTA